jgi:hypothetical protein
MPRQQIEAVEGRLRRFQGPGKDGGGVVGKMEMMMMKMLTCLDWCADSTILMMIIQLSRGKECILNSRLPKVMR